MLRSGDADQDAANLKEFNEAAAASTAIDDGPNGAKILRVGKNGWTLPLPLVKTDAGWRFDVAKGKEEMTNRRVGYNELSAIEACKAYVAAQDEYFRLDRDGNGLREYARRFISTPGTHDGLYWPPEDQADISPLDGFAEDANLAARSGEKPEPYDGYYFRILTAQGPAAPGGAFSYLINGHMIAGHAMIAGRPLTATAASRLLSAARTASSTKRTSGRTPPLSAPRWPSSIPTRPGRSSSSGDICFTALVVPIGADEDPSFGRALLLRQSARRDYVRGPTRSLKRSPLAGAPRPPESMVKPIRQRLAPPLEERPRLLAKTAKIASAAT